MPPRLRLLPLALLLVVSLGACQAAKTASSRGSGAAPAVTPTRPVAGSSPLAGADQVVLVVADSWDTNQARLRRFKRAAGGHFVPMGDDVAVTLGTSGLAWGRGLHGAALGPGPVKVEGDRRSPAGVFALPFAFAYRPEELWKTPKLPVHRVTARTVCVETIDSKAYNRILDEDPAMSKDWESPDRMLRSDDLYRYGLFVAHNTPDVKPGAGSCIFMHLWRRPGAPTAGCTAMNEPAMLAILAWIDAARRPVLVQLPRAELKRLAPAWGAPELTIPPKRNDE